jgi:hypothetical protein
MSKEPVKTVKQDGRGRPEITDNQHWEWLDEMRPFLITGMSLWSAIEKAGLESHKNSIYQKYADDNNFKEKIDHYRATIAELNNQIIYNTIRNISIRQATLKDITNPSMTTEEVQIVKLVAEKHRTSQPFFVTRTEVAEAKDEDFGKIIEPAKINYVLPDGADLAETEKKPNAETKPISDPKPGDQLSPDDQATHSMASPN